MRLHGERLASRFFACALVLAVSIAAVSGRAFALTPPHDATNGIGCEDCHALHGGGMFGAVVPRDAEQEALCKSCHNPTGQAAAFSDVANHVVGGGARIVDCGSCHDAHSPDSSTDSHAGGQTALNLHLVRANTTKYVAEALVPAVFQTSPDHFAFADPPYNGVCQTCHTQTNHHQNDGTAPGGQSHHLGEVCTGCHTHESGFAPIGGPHPQAVTDCGNCHLDPATGQPDLQGLHNSDCPLCHVSGYDSTFLGPLGTWNGECSACHNPNVAETGNFPTPTKGHRCVVCHDERGGSVEEIHSKHVEKANCVVCHGFIPDTQVAIGSGDRTNCALCHGGSYQNTAVEELHKKMVPKGTSCIECHTDGRPPVDVVPGTPVGGAVHVCDVCHSGKSPSEFSSDMENLHKKHVGKRIDCGACHADAILQDDRDPMPAVDDARRALVDRVSNHECSFCHAGGKSGDPEQVHQKHANNQWQWCYNCHEGDDTRPLGLTGPVTQPSEACVLCHSGRTYNDAFPFSIHEKHSGKKKAVVKCYACHQATTPIRDWPDSWR